MFLSTLFLLSIPLKLTFADYDEELARRLVHFCGAVYCIDDEAFGNSYENLVFDWECETCGYLRDTSEIEAVYPFQDRNIFLDVEGMVTYDSQNNAITVTFAGTDPTEIADIVTDIELIRTEYPPCGGRWFWEDDCTVHKGFYRAYRSIEDDVYNLVKNLKNTYSDATLEITGHSLGGAMAILCAIDFVVGHSEAIMPDYVYTFGQPRVGDDEFVAFYESEVGSGKTWRVTHKKDPVPLVPWTTWGWNYLHGAQEVYYPDDSYDPNNPDSSYTICDGSGEDSNCIQQHNWWEVLLNIFIINDHLQYLDVDFFTAVIECNIGLDIDGDNGGSGLPGGNMTQNTTYDHYMNVVLNWTRYGSTLYTPDEIANSIGLQTLLGYSLREAAVAVRYDLEDDSDIFAKVLNVTDISNGANETIQLNIKASFNDMRKYRGFKNDLPYILHEFDIALKDALSLQNVTQVIIYSDDDGTTGIETTSSPDNNNNGCSCTPEQTDEGGLKKDNENDEDEIQIWVIILIGIGIVVVIFAVYIYTKNKVVTENSIVKKREKNTELSSKDQFAAVKRVTTTSPMSGPESPMEY